MFKLLIVDDEPLIREGLRKSIDWNSLGFTVVGEAADGSEALQLVETFHPDVIMTDMKMEIMDGTTLIHNVKASYPNIQIVILTAYNEFSFAKTAIDNDVFAYISKPTLNADIENTFIRLYEKIQYDRQTKNMLRSYENYRANDLMKKILLNPLSDIKDIDDLHSILAQTGIVKDFFVAVIEVENSAAVNTEENTALLKKFINNNMTKYENAVYIINIYENEYALLIFSSTRTFSYQSIFLQKLIDEFIKNHSITFSIGVSATFRNISHISQAYSQAKSALQNKSAFYTGKIIDFMSSDKIQPITLSDDDLDDIYQNIQNCNNTLTLLKLNEYFDLLKTKNYDISAVYVTTAKLYKTIINGIFPSKYTRDLILGSNGDIPSKNQIRTAEDAKLYLTNLVDKALIMSKGIKTINLEFENYSNTTIQAIYYIFENYEKNIKISDISNILHISDSRLMHLFKAETGQTFYNVLTEYRIRIAEVLIKTGKYKMYEIAELVGYNNPVSFRKAFQKITNNTPIKYK